MGNRRYSEVSVCDMADCRERRVMRQNELIKTLGLPVVSFTMNIAGPVKNSRLFEFGFAIGLESIAEELGEHAARTEIIRANTGCEALIATAIEADELKERMMRIEANASLGRWYDIDVIGVDGVKKSRPYPRCCIICGREVTQCARSRAHSAEELQARTVEAYIDALSHELGKLAREALYDEVHLTPKPGLVDERNSGANTDMSIGTFERSMEVLEPFFTLMAAEGAAENNRQHLMHKLQELGKEAECAMLKATDGVNTHRGAIFSLGLIVAAYANAVVNADAMSEDDDCLSCAAITARAAELAACQQVETKENSNGSIVRKTYGVGGAREQARAGFPTAKRVLSCYDEYRQRGFFTPWLAGLLTAMAELDDNNALKRGGSSGAELVKKRAVELLSLGSGLTIDLLEAFDDELIALNISCGGSADLLACAMLLDKLGKKQLL